MRSETRKLDSLPVEIIRRIAAYGPCQSALALLKVNRALHQACNDRLVFRNIINNGNGSSCEIPVWHFTALTLQSPVSSWARYALADSRLARTIVTPTEHNRPIVYDYREDAHGIEEQYLKYGAPQMMALHHPLIDHANIIILQLCLKNLEDNRARSSDAQPLSFCLATRVMSREFYDSHQHLAPSGRKDRIREELLFVLRHCLYDSHNVQSISANTPELVALKHALANRAVGIFSFDLRCALLGNRVLHPPDFQQPLRPVVRLQPPTTLDIPFSSFMDVPLPFSPNAVENFRTCHLSMMTSAAFLEDGEWVGYYCASISRINNPTFDPPMTGIHFTTSRNADGSRYLSLAADGVDGIGEFHVQGEIDPETGRITMRKQYNIGMSWEWDWYAMMTPFGIVGSWGSTYAGGWFWLWKDKWVERSQFPA